MTATAFDTNTTFNRLSDKLLPVFTGKLLPVLFLTIIMVLYSRKLSYDEYGRFQTVWIYTNIISVVISFGLSAVILSSGFDFFSRFFLRHRSKILGIYSLGALISFAFFYFTTHYFASVTKLLLIVFILLQCACTLTDTLLIRNNYLRVYVWVNLAYTALFFAVHLYFYFYPFVLNQLIAGIIVVALVKAFFIFLAVRKPAEYIERNVPVKFVRNWFFIGANEIAGIIVKWLDKLFLLYLLSPAEFAIFFNGSFEIPLFGILVSTMEYIMLTNISANISDQAGAKNIFRESFKVLSLVAFPLFFFLLSMHAEGFQWIFTNKYNASVPVFLVSIFIIPVRINHYGVILQCYGQAHKIAMGSVLDIAMSLLLMFIFYPLMGTPGVALAIVVSTWLQAAFYLWQSAVVIKRSVKELIPLAFLGRFALSLAAVYGSIYYLKQYVSSLFALITVFILTTFIIGSGLILYWKKSRQQ